MTERIPDTKNNKKFTSTWVRKPFVSELHQFIGCSKWPPPASMHSLSLRSMLCCILWNMDLIKSILVYSTPVPNVDVLREHIQNGSDQIQTPQDFSREYSKASIAGSGDASKQDQVILNKLTALQGINNQGSRHPSYRNPTGKSAHA